MPQAKDAADEQKQARLSRQVRAEIISTEETYSANMSCLNDFIKSIKDSEANSPKGKFRNSAEGAKFLAAVKDIEVISRTSNALLADLKVVSGDSAEMAKVLLKYAPFFKAYTDYIARHGEMTAALVQFAQKHPNDFDELGKSFQRGSGGLTLDSFLIMPIQRIPRYPLLLDALTKHSSLEDQPAMAIICKAVEDAALEINNSVARRQKVLAEMELTTKYVANNVSQKDKSVEFSTTGDGFFKIRLLPGEITVQGKSIAVSKEGTIKVRIGEKDIEFQVVKGKVGGKIIKGRDASRHFHLVLKTNISPKDIGAVYAKAEEIGVAIIDKLITPEEQQKQKITVHNPASSAEHVPLKIPVEKEEAKATAAVPPQPPPKPTGDARTKLTQEVRPPRQEAQKVSEAVDVRLKSVTEKFRTTETTASAQPEKQKDPLGLNRELWTNAKFLRQREKLGGAQQSADEQDGPKRPNR